MKTTLTTVPTFTLNQGDPFNQDFPSEYPITVRYFNDDIIELEQQGHTVNIHANFLNDLFKEIKGHLSEANRFIKKR